MADPPSVTSQEAHTEPVNHSQSGSLTLCHDVSYPGHQLIENRLNILPCTYVNAFQLKNSKKLKRKTEASCS